MLAEKACGKNVCAEDEECCNSSCGMCVKKGGSCTEQFCDYEVVDSAPGHDSARRAGTEVRAERAGRGVLLQQQLQPVWRRWGGCAPCSFAVTRPR